MKLPVFKPRLVLPIKLLLKAIVFLLPFVAGFGFIVYFLVLQNNRITQAEKVLTAIENSQSQFTQNFADALFEDHLKVSTAMATESTVSALLAEVEKLKTVESYDTSDNISEVYDALAEYTKKLERNTNAKLEVPDDSASEQKWGALLLEKDFDGLLLDIETTGKPLDEAYTAYLAKVEKERAAAQAAAQSAAGYNYQTVHTERGSFNISYIKAPISGTKVKTLSAANGSCKDNCATKSLAQYVSENGGFAGMNGSYFCPPDYPSCGGKVNSSDYALYDSNEKNWEHKAALSWFKTGLMTFKDGSAKFYKKSSDYGGGGVSAGISNYPSLVQDGNIVVKDSEMTSYQKDVKGPRGVLGLGSESIYLAIIYNATVKDAAYAIRALGAKDALNLDGGGSSALYVNGRYVVGPGRSLPNAIVLVK